jgi:Putative transmembrane protein (PGPGW)
LIGRIKEDWRLFKASKPGYRFRDHYRRHRRRSRQRISRQRISRQRSPSQGLFNFRKVLFIVVGSAIAITSIVLGPLPGPGLGTFLLGLVILASELRIVARFLDWAEVMLKRPARRAKGAWASLPRWASILLGAGLWTAGVTFGLWVLLYGFR